MNPNMIDAIHMAAYFAEVNLADGGATVMDISKVYIHGVYS